jgi:hypothetical protein
MNKLLVGLAIAALWVASATAGVKSYTVTISHKCTLGGVELTPGAYRMKIESSTAVLANEESGQVAKAPVTVTTAAKKYDQTEILSTKVANSPDRIDAIELQGTKLKVQFKN